MSDVIFAYITPNKRGRSLGPVRTCKRPECKRVFQPPLDRKRQIFCSNICANRDHAEKRWLERPRCARPGCAKRFKRRRKSHSYCSRACYDMAIFAPVETMRDQTAPMCCGEALFFATDFLGRTTQICRLCGERPVPVESALFPLATGIPNRVGTLRGAGNSISPQVAAAFVTAYLACQGGDPPK